MVHLEPPAAASEPGSERFIFFLPCHFAGKKRYHKMIVLMATLEFVAFPIEFYNVLRPYYPLQ